MTIELKQEILDLIESPKLHAYLMEDTERLKLRDYVSIIAGAPVGLKRKQGLLYKLRATSDTKQGLFRKMSWIGMIILKENENVRTAT